MRWSLALFALVVACTRANPEPTPTVNPSGPAPKAGTLITLTPDDLLTDLGVTPLKVLLGTQGDDVVKAVADQTQLRTYPELSPVGFTLKIQYARPGDFVTSGNGKPPMAGQLPATSAEIQIVPASKLDEGQWYVLSVASLPEPLPASFRSRPQLGARYARFRYGSAPVTRLVTVGTTGGVLVAFSEKLNADEATVSQLLSVETGGKACTLIPNPSTPPLPPGTLSISYGCPPSIASSKTLRLGMKPGLKGFSGADVGLINSSAVTSASIVQTGSVVRDITVSEGSGQVGWVP